MRGNYSLYWGTVRWNKFSIHLLKTLPLAGNLETAFYKEQATYPIVTGETICFVTWKEFPVFNLYILFANYFLPPMHFPVTSNWAKEVSVTFCRMFLLVLSFYFLCSVVAFHFDCRLYTKCFFNHPCMDIMVTEEFQIMLHASVWI